MLFRQLTHSRAQARESPAAWRLGRLVLGSRPPPLKVVYWMLHTPLGLGDIIPNEDESPACLRKPGPVFLRML